MDADWGDGAGGGAEIAGGCLTLDLKQFTIGTGGDEPFYLFVMELDAHLLDFDDGIRRRKPHFRSVVCEGT